MAKTKITEINGNLLYKKKPFNINDYPIFDGKTYLNGLYINSFFNHTGAYDESGDKLSKRLDLGNTKAVANFLSEIISRIKTLLNVGSFSKENTKITKANNYSLVEVDLENGYKACCLNFVVHAKQNSSYQIAFSGSHQIAFLIPSNIPYKNYIKEFIKEMYAGKSDGSHALSNYYLPNQKEGLDSNQEYDYQPLKNLHEKLQKLQP